jgi:hypothetical protein
MSRARTLAELRKVRGRFARSVSVERDSGTTIVDSYLPTGRSLDAVRRFARSMHHPDGGRALSITGPYGSGKSSLAVFVDALVAPAETPARQAAEDILAAADPDALELFRTGRAVLKADRSGFVRAVLTAQREPIVLSVLRALRRGAMLFETDDGQAESGRKQLLGLLEEAMARVSDPTAARPTAQFVHQVLDELASLAPVLLVLDEFGKNLEAFGDTPAEADLFLLQQLAEWSHGETGLPLFTFTLQHLAFEDYVETASAAQRREWAKVQGRFEDIPFVDTPNQTRNLIAGAFEPSIDSVFAHAVKAWADKELAGCRKVGITDLLGRSEIMAACWPLHPVTQLVLPDLCARYGQNERTLFSFLASQEPLSVTSFLTEHPWQPKRPLPAVRADRVYDYFIDSASTMIGVSQSASRWLEVETLIRDAIGLTDGERRALKTIGVLNLVTAGGTLRASRALLSYALADGRPGTEDEAAVARVLASLEARSLITFRDFADEYRLWRGSDVDLKAAIDLARRRLRPLGPAELLERVKPLPPMVAARHSQQTGTLRAFTRAWGDAGTTAVTPPKAAGPTDGLVVYLLEPSAGFPTIRSAEAMPKPVVAVRPATVDGLLTAALEVAAVQEVLDTEEQVRTDWVAQRELRERAAEAAHRLDTLFEAAFGTLAEATWTMLGPDKTVTRIDAAGGSTSALSDVADLAYPDTPPVPNEMLNRTELTSQGAKARRELLLAMLTRAELDRLGIEGYGPDRAMYEAVLRATGIHRHLGDRWGFAPPKTSGYQATWKAITASLQAAKKNRIGLDQVITRLLGPPIGMRAGVAPVLITAAMLVHGDEIAVYEHGTFRPVLSPEVSERMVRNPAHFEVKHFATQQGVRKHLLDHLGVTLGVRPVGPRQRNSSMLAVVGYLVSLVNALPEYTKRTTVLSQQAAAVRQILLSATEPDVLLFEDLPAILGHEAVPPTAPKRDWPLYARFAIPLAEACAELTAAYATLLGKITTAVQRATGARTHDPRSNLAARAADLAGKIVDKRVQAFAKALTANSLGDQEWAEYVAMVVAGTPPQAWSEDDRIRFFSLVAELGATFRRLEALHFDRAAADRDGFDALRITVTSSDGNEDARVVAIGERQRQVLEPLLDEILGKAAAATAPADQAQELLLVLLAERNFAAHDLAVTSGWQTPEITNQQERNVNG